LKDRKDVGKNWSVKEEKAVKKAKIAS